MAKQQQSRASPDMRFSIARQAMADAVAFYLAHGGPAVARMHVENLAGELLKIYDDATEAYREAMTLISQAEKAERQRADERQQQMLHEEMVSLMSAIRPSDGQDAPQDSASGGVLPPKLSTERAMLVWQRLQQAGYVDAAYRTAGLSRTESAVLAFEMARLLGIKTKWKTFELLWHHKGLRSDYNLALNQRKSLTFRDELKSLLSDFQ